VTSKDLKVT